MTRAVAGLLTLTVTLACPAVGADDRRITNASSVRLRWAPATNAPVTGELPLGTELSALDHTPGADPWYHVKTDDGREGWVLGSLTTPLDPARRVQIIESIVEGRVRAGGDFSAGVQLVDLIERTAARLGDGDARGRFALNRLRAFSAVFYSVPSGIRDTDVETRRPEAEPYADWIFRHRDAARYFESAGQWMVDPDYVRAVHEQQRDSTAAEGIAWFYVENGLYGECEGSVPCYVQKANELEGWYLKSHPRGRHADEATD